MLEKALIYGDVLSRIYLNDLIENVGSADSRRTLELSNVLTDDKMAYREGTISFDLDRNTILLFSAMYLRHMAPGPQRTIKGIDFLIDLDASPENTVSRKIERDKSRGYDRNPEVTMNMVKLTEDPLIKSRREKYVVDRGIIIEMNNFNRISLKRS